MKSSSARHRCNRRNFCKKTLLLGSISTALLVKRPGKRPRPAAPVAPAADNKRPAADAPCSER